MSDFLAVAAIDFGTTYSGIAFSFSQDYVRCPLKIDCTQWHSTGGSCRVSLKTPTTVLFSPRKEFRAFGYAAQDEYAEMADDNAHSGWIYYNNFKMMLHSTHLTRETVLRDAIGNTIPLMKVFAECIKDLKKEVIDKLKKRGDLVKEHEIRWVLTVPAIWRDQAKQFMRESAKLAGIENKRLLLALEPEAASVYAKESLSQRVESEGEVTLAPYDPGTKYMVVDAGGGTVDITMREVLPGSKLREIYKATGGDWGGLKVNEAILDFIKKLVGEDVIDELYNNHRSEYLDLEREIEAKKRFSMTTGKSDRIKFKLPGSLSDIYRERRKQDLSNRICFGHENLVGKIDIKRGSLRIDKQIAKTFYDYTIKKTVSHIKTLLLLTEAQAIKDIILVGGCAESELFTKTMQDEFPNIKIVIPEDAGLSVLKGAVLYGHNPSVVTQRVSKLTYGTRVMRYFLEGEDDDSKKKMYGKHPYCMDVFNKLAEADETYEIGKPVESEDLFPIDESLTRMTVKFYTSTEKHPKYVTDNGCSPLGDLTVDMPSKGDKMNQNVKARLTFGDTELICELEDVTSGETVQSLIDTLSVK